jgi:hypothetical protein
LNSGLPRFHRARPSTSLDKSLCYSILKDKYVLVKHDKFVV